ncbi:sulfotransferase [Pararhizobium sp. IMCC21322]|uniref:sulfotransferase n=1 Tax=Pararhizobium sp. IMCC21322 TaxID=3067903 RepID=UPI003531D9C2
MIVCIISSIFFDRIPGQGGDTGLDRETAIAAYRANNAKVRKTIPADKLLIFSPSDGWEPLCRFCGAPVPVADFRHSGFCHQLPPQQCMYLRRQNNAPLRLGSRQYP